MGDSKFRSETYLRSNHRPLPSTLDLNPHIVHRYFHGHTKIGKKNGFQPAFDGGLQLYQDYWLASWGVPFKPLTILQPVNQFSINSPFSFIDSHTTQLQLLQEALTKKTLKLFFKHLSTYSQHEDSGKWNFNQFSGYKFLQRVYSIFFDILKNNSQLRRSGIEIYRRNIFSSFVLREKG